mgnify:CR=1 FL=1
MENNEHIIQLLQDIKELMGQHKEVLNIDDLVRYTGLSKSKIYKLTHLKLIPMGNNKHIRQKFFDKKSIDKWLLGNPNVSDEYLEQKFNERILKSSRFG